MMEKRLIAICDDDKTSLPVISGAVRSAFEAENEEVEVRLFSSPDALLQTPDIQSYFAMFLDIGMPELDGIELGERLRSKGADAAIVFVSQREERVFDCFTAFPFGFVRKSQFLTDLAETVGRLLDKDHAVSDAPTAWTASMADSLS